MRDAVPVHILALQLLLHPRALLVHRRVLEAAEMVPDSVRAELGHCVLQLEQALGDLAVALVEDERVPEVVPHAGLGLLRGQRQSGDGPARDEGEKGR